MRNLLVFLCRQTAWIFLHKGIVYFLAPYLCCNDLDKAYMNIVRTHNYLFSRLLNLASNRLE